MKLAVIASHPVQYYAPWFQALTRREGIQLRVFYLWDAGVKETLDRGFGKAVKWDIPLLDGYENELVPNVSRDPGTHRFFGLRNPSLSDAVGRFSPDAVLLIGYRYDSLFRFVAKWSGRVPLLFRGDSHRLAQTPGDAWRRVKRHLLKLWFRRFSAILYVGQANRGYFEMHGVRPEKLFFSPHAVDNDRFQSGGQEMMADARRWREELGIPPQHRVVLFAGKFEENKRPLDLLAAFKAGRFRDATLLFVGDGRLEKELRETAGDTANIRFAPFQNQSLMPRAYAAADLCVLPSLSETWGLAVNEAMAVGRAVVVSNHVGCAADLVRPMENGLVFDAGDVGSLTAALREALSDDERLARWGEASRGIVADYSYDAATSGLLRALDYVNGRKSA